MRVKAVTAGWSLRTTLLNRAAFNRLRIAGCCHDWQEPRSRVCRTSRGARCVELVPLSLVGERWNGNGLSLVEAGKSSIDHVLGRGA